MSDRCESCGHLDCYTVRDRETGDWVNQCELVEFATH